jgi:hypothetical protein
MGTAFAFGLGVVVGALLAFRAGGRYALARQASLIAGEYMGVARKLWGNAGGAVALFVLVVAGGIMIMMFS